MIYYIYSPEDETFIDEVKIHLAKQEVTYLQSDALASLAFVDLSHILVSGSLDMIKKVFLLAVKHDCSVGIIPKPTQKSLIRTFNLSRHLEDAVSCALIRSEKKIDLFYANENLVLQEVVVGDAPPLDQFDDSSQKRTFVDSMKVFWRTLQKVKELKHAQITVSDAKENSIKLSAVGLVAVEYNNDTFAAKLISSKLSANDGKLSIVILSPTSILQYMGYLYRSLVSHLTPKTLPKSVGYMSGTQMYIESKDPLKVLIDSSIAEVTPVIFEVKKEQLALSVGEKFWDKQAAHTTDKDSLKVDHLPRDEESSVYLSKTIPIFSHASKAQYATLFTQLREESKVSRNFMVLLILATMIATFGLFINSSSIIIGAMLLAPLMQPIVSLSMGVLRQDSTLELNGAKTIAIGVLSVLLTAAIIALLLPMQRLTVEMLGRLSPTILDLFVAIVSGAAAAYAKSNEKVLGSLAGVAIAVALVPPIAVAGIGLGWGDLGMFSQAFLLFVTNLVGIVFAAALMFAMLGFSPLHLAKKGVMIWLIIVGLVALPLASAFESMKEDIQIQKILSNLAFNVGTHDVKLTHIELVHRSKSEEIRCEVISTGILDKEEKLRLKDTILKSIDKYVEVVVTFRYKL